MSQNVKTDQYLLFRGIDLIDLWPHLIQHPSFECLDVVAVLEVKYGHQWSLDLKRPSV